MSVWGMYGHAQRPVIGLNSTLGFSSVGPDGSDSHAFG